MDSEYHMLILISCRMKKYPNRLLVIVRCLCQRQLVATDVNWDQYWS
jgi:hypothetical protein